MTVPDEAAGADGAAEAAGAGGPDGNNDTGVAGEETAVTANESVWTQASEEADESGEAKVGESWAAGNARVAEENDQARDEPPAQTVDVVFSLPAETKADHVALCGEFNDWSPEATGLSRGDDRSWRVTVPLAPGTYRYKFLLDGETWENGTDADRYEENAYGTTDSVIVVS
jgi:1,4-alpha-glucan branching enzyme